MKKALVATGVLVGFLGLILALTTKSCAIEVRTYLMGSGYGNAMDSGATDAAGRFSYLEASGR